jgi:hypothetical protein
MDFFGKCATFNEGAFCPTHSAAEAAFGAKCGIQRLGIGAVASPQEAQYKCNLRCGSNFAKQQRQ